MPGDPRPYRVAVVGATGVVGTTVVTLLAERGFPCKQVDLLASSRSAGTVMDAGGVARTVFDLDGFDFDGIDIAFFSAGAGVSREHAARAVSAGAVVIDNTNAFRMRLSTPLVVPQVNGHLLERRPPGGIIANPNCATIPLTRLLRPIAAEWGIDDVVVSTYQAASGRGRAGIGELTDRTRQCLDDPSGAVAGPAFPQGLAFNVVPLIDELRPDGFTVEEKKIEQEAAKILELPRLRLTATCVRVPVVTGHSEAVLVRTIRPVDRDRVASAFAALPEVRVWHGAGAPTPRAEEGSDEVHVGRIRVTGERNTGLWFWLVSDNVRVGAALNAVQIAEGLRDRGAL